MALKISELVSALNKVSAAVGDAPVEFKALEGDAESFLHSIGIELGPDGSPATTKVTLNHSQTAPAPPVTEEPPAPEATTGDQVANPNAPIS